MVSEILPLILWWRCDAEKLEIWTVEIWLQNREWGCWDRRGECFRNWSWIWCWSWIWWWIFCAWRWIWEGGFGWRRRKWFLRTESRWSLCCGCASLFSVRARLSERASERERERMDWEVDWDGKKMKKSERFFFVDR